MSDPQYNPNLHNLLKQGCKIIYPSGFQMQVINGKLVTNWGGDNPQLEMDLCLWALHTAQLDRRDYESSLQNQGESMGEKLLYITWPESRSVRESEMRIWAKDAMDNGEIDYREDWETCPIEELAAALHRTGNITWFGMTSENKDLER